MTIIDDRTTNLSLALPNVANKQTEDIPRLRESLTTIDAEFVAFDARKADLVGGKVPADQLPSYVDDVLEFASLAAFPATGEAGKIYIAINTGKTYRWTGSTYGIISDFVLLPATPTTLGAVKVGSGLGIDPDGVLYVVGGGGGGVPVYGDQSIVPASNGQTTFAVTGGYNPGQLDVFLSGVLLVGNGDDYTASNGTTFTLTVGANTTDLLLVRKWIYLPAAQALNKTGDTMTGALNWAPAVDVASAATTQIGLAASNRVRVTGTTTITSLGTIAAGVCRTVTFAGALTLTHNATSLILPGGANITTAAGDVAEFESLGAGNWRCTGYQKANGQAVVSPAMPTPQSLNRGAYVPISGIDNGATLVSNTRYGAYTGNGAFSVTMPSFANSSPGDEIVIGQVANSWLSNAFTINFPANVLFFNLSGGGETQLICNTLKPQGFRLYCAWKDGMNAYWVLA